MGERRPGLPGRPIDTGYSWDPCSTGTFAIKEAGQTPPLPVFSSFTAYLPETLHELQDHRERGLLQARAQLAFALQSNRGSTSMSSRPAA